MSRLFNKLKEEYIALLPPTIYFFVALHLVALVRALMLKGTGLAALSSLSVTLAALVLGKSVLIADMLPGINRFPHRPLIYNVAWKTVIYMVVATIIHYLERLVEFWQKTGSFAAANEKLLANFIWPHFLAVQILLFVLVLTYCIMHELVRVVGRGKMKQIFFGPL